MPKPRPKRSTSEIKLDKISKPLEAIQSLLTILAILCAAWWFFAQAESAPKVNIKHSITHRKIHNDWTWVYVSTTLTNQGKTPVRINEGIAWLQKILPLDESIVQKIALNKKLTSDDGRIEWQRLGEVHNLKPDVQIDPGTEHTIYFEFLIPSNIEVVLLYTGFPYDGTEYGWDLATVHDLADKRSNHEDVSP